MSQNMTRQAKRLFSPTVTVIIIFGIISMLGDMVYETARSANSQYFKTIGIDAATMGFVFGVGELLGYGLRLLAGVLSDRTRKQWVFMFVGYGMLIVVPLMGFTLNWNILVILILMERIGKSLRSPAKDTVLSSVAKGQEGEQGTIGIGFAFGLQEALDQLGAFAGPLVFTLVFSVIGKSTLHEYQLGYRLLLIPFALLMVFLTFAYRKIKREHLIREMSERAYKKERLPKVFWIYTLFTITCTLGFVNFSTTGYHAKASGIMSDGNITLLYSLAMGVDAVAAMVVGHLYDRLKKKRGSETGGLMVMAAIPLLTAFLPFLTLSDNPTMVTIGMLLFGVVMGTHETVMRSAIADITPFYKRGTSYGVFNTGYGLALFGGAWGMGVLYQGGHIAWIGGLVVVAEVIATLIFVYMMQQLRYTKDAH